MSKYILVTGDKVIFTDPKTKKDYRGYIQTYLRGRDPVPNQLEEYRRDYLIKFDEPWNNHERAWCASHDLELVSPSVQTSFTVSPNSYKDKKDKYDKENIRVTVGSSLNQSTISHGLAGGNGSGSAFNNDRPWTAYFLTSDEFFDLLKVAFDDTYGSDHGWHPEDLYINVSSVLEVVSNTLSNMVRLRNNRPLSGVKEL